MTIVAIVVGIAVLAILALRFDPAARRACRYRPSANAFAKAGLDFSSLK